MADASPSAAMGDRSEVTSIIRHDVKEAERHNYEAWLLEIVPLASRFPGHRGVNVIRPAKGASEYTIVLHFDTIDNLRAWLNSSERHDLIAKILPWLVGRDEVEIKTGLEFWFTPASKEQRARPYKQFLVALSVIFPLTLLMPPLLRPVLALYPPLDLLLVRQLVTDAIIVALMTYVIMPRYTKLIARWLFKG